MTVWSARAFPRPALSSDCHRSSWSPTTRRSSFLFFAAHHPDRPPIQASRRAPYLLDPPQPTLTPPSFPLHIHSYTVPDPACHIPPPRNFPPGSHVFPLYSPLFPCPRPRRVRSHRRRVEEPVYLPVRVALLPVLTTDLYLPLGSSQIVTPCLTAQTPRSATPPTRHGVEERGIPSATTWTTSRTLASRRVRRALRFTPVEFMLTRDQCGSVPCPRTMRVHARPMATRTTVTGLLMSHSSTASLVPLMISWPFPTRCTGGACTNLTCYPRGVI